MTLSLYHSREMDDYSKNFKDNSRFLGESDVPNYALPSFEHTKEEEDRMPLLFISDRVRRT